MVNDNHKDFVKAIISMEKGISDESYDAYMDNDTVNLMHEGFDYMIEDLREQGQIKDLPYVQEEKDNLINIVGNIVGSFVPEEVSFEEAHQVVIELCEKILGGKYEYVLATHIDKDHIHNHIIFNSIDVDEGKVYHSYFGSYMNIRNQSDRLCKEHNLSVIDQETQREINEIKHRKFVNWYDWNEDKKDNSYKSKLQFDIDRIIKQSINWQDFLSKMGSYGYEIKHGKHIAFRSKNQQRFTRAKTIGANYTEERMKERILNKDKELGNIIDIKNNIKAKTSKGYEHWVTKHNLKTEASTLVEIRNKGFNSMEELERGTSRIPIEKNDLKREFDKLSWEKKG